MPKPSTLKKVGSNVKVNLDLVVDRIPTELISKLENNPRGKVLDYKMTDGTGIGLVVELSDGSRSWFFENEIIAA